MKKNILVIIVCLISFHAFAQVAQKFPAGFRKAKIPERFKNTGIDLNERNVVENQFLLSRSVIPNESVNYLNSVQEEAVGITFYDLQTYGSISNRLIVNNDGTIATAWTTSPDAIVTTNPPFPSRGSGYNYFDGSTWIYTTLSGIREESVRTGSTNLVNTASGIEMLIAHNNTSNQLYNNISIARRITKGSGAWTMYNPFGISEQDFFPKACSADENVYIIWHGGNSFPVAGQSGPIYFSHSSDGGNTWSAKVVPNLIDSVYYKGFGADNYSIDAKNNIVVIGFGDKYTDVGILKSLDSGQTWTKTIIQPHPISLYNKNFNSDANNDGIADTLLTNNGDVNVLIDNNGMAHVWFSKTRYYYDSLGGFGYFPHEDGLQYWNESMGANNYVEIAAAQDYNGNGILDFPHDTSWAINSGHIGYYPIGGLTIMPSAGIDASGKIYLTYSSVNESTDTSVIAELSRHIYISTLAPPYSPSDWSYPYDIIPSIASGGMGEMQEGAFASIARSVDNNFAYILYQRDERPGIRVIAPPGSWDSNQGPSDLILTKVETITLNNYTNNRSELFISQNYPNPVKGTTYINISIKNPGDVRFEVCDIIGKPVYSETRKRLAEGNHTISFDASKLSAGIYNYTVTSNGQRLTKQMIRK